MPRDASRDYLPYANNSGGGYHSACNGACYTGPSSAYASGDGCHAQPGAGALTDTPESGGAGDTVEVRYFLDEAGMIRTGEVS